jgi:hypothetical protein
VFIASEKIVGKEADNGIRKELTFAESTKE